MEGFYKSTMRAGPRLLLAVAVTLFFANLLQRFELLRGINLQVLGPDNQLQFEWLQALGVIFSAVASAVTPLVGAIIVNRLDGLLDQSALPPKNVVSELGRS